MKTLLTLALLALPLAAQQRLVNINYDFTGIAVCAPGTTQAVLPCYKQFEIVPGATTQAQAATVTPIATVAIGVSSGSTAVSGIPIPFTFAGFGVVGIIMLGQIDNTPKMLASDPQKCLVTFPPNSPTGAVVQ